MALKLSDILNGIPDFSAESQDTIKTFIAKTDMIHTLAHNQEEIVLTVIRAKLSTANKLGDISTLKWNKIKSCLREKYRTTISFETAQERLLSISQGQTESLESYSNRVINLLDTLNLTTMNDNLEIQAANRGMNECLAIRKYKQNIADERIRIMTLAAKHETLAEAIQHANLKLEQLNASNFENEFEKKETESDTDDQDGDEDEETSGETSNDEESSDTGNIMNKNDEPETPKIEDDKPCTYCKKTNHQSRQCFFRPKLSNNEGKTE